MPTNQVARLQRDIASEAGIARAVHFAHAAGAGVVRVGKNKTNGSKISGRMYNRYSARMSKTEILAKMESLVHMIWIIGCLGILVLGALYGYWIGIVGKRRSWSGKKVKIVTLIPIPLVGVVLGIASKISREASGSGNPAAAWAEFPWTVTLLAGFLAMFIAAKVAYPGVPLSDLEKDNLSIR